MEGKKLFIIIGGVLLAVILTVTLIFMFKGEGPQREVVESPPLQSNPVDTQSPAPSDNQLAGNPLEEDTDKENNSTVINLGDSIQDGEIEATHPEIDWEEPPVMTVYNPEADTNSDGHVDKAEWEVWVENHPEDLDQDMFISDEEIAAMQDPTGEAAESIKPVTPEEWQQQQQEILENNESNPLEQPEEGSALGDPLSDIAEWVAQQQASGTAGTRPTDFSDHEGSSSDGHGNWSVPDLKVK